MHTQTTSTRSPSRSRAFTLIELIVVLAILLLLASAALIGIRNGQIARRDSQRLADVLSIAQAVDKYTAANRGILPASGGANACISSALFGSKLDQYLPSYTVNGTTVSLPPAVLPAVGAGCITYTQNTIGSGGTNLSDTLSLTYSLDVSLERPISEEPGLYITDGTTELGPFKKVPGAPDPYRYYYPGSYCGTTCP